jgi:hypothetical protein
LSDEALRERLRKLAKLYILRAQGTSSEDQIAQELGFTDGRGAPSAQVMYERLQGEWGIPGWIVYPNGAGERIETTKEPKPRDTDDTKKSRKVRSTGNAEQLPPAVAASELFRTVLRKLRRYVDPPEPPVDRPVGFMDIDFTDGAGELSFLEEYLQAGRFVSASVTRPDPEEIHTVLRKECAPEEWERICNEYGEDPTQDYFLIGAEMGLHAEGAKHYPSHMLVELIGVYVLTGAPLEPLLEKLHPEPEKADREQLERLVHGYKKGKGYIPGMMDKAWQISRLMRAVAVGRGPSVGRLSELDLHVAWSINQLKEQGLSYAQIHRGLKERNYPHTRADVERLDSWGDEIRGETSGRGRGAFAPPSTSKSIRRATLATFIV